MEDRTKNIQKNLAFLNKVSKERNSDTFEGIQYSSKHETFSNAKVSKKRDLTYIGRLTFDSSRIDSWETLGLLFAS